MLEENFGTHAGVRLIKGVPLIWGPRNTGFTVSHFRVTLCLCFNKSPHAESFMRTEIHLIENERASEFSCE